MENMTLVDFLNNLNYNSTGSGYDINSTNTAVGEVFKHIAELKEKLESALASYDDYQDRWMQATAKLEDIESNKVAEFSGVVTEDGLSKFLNLYNEKNRKVGMLIGYEDGEIDSEMKVTISKDKQ